MIFKDPVIRLTLKPKAIAWRLKGAGESLTPWHVSFFHAIQYYKGGSAICISTFVLRVQDERQEFSL